MTIGGINTIYTPGKGLSRNWCKPPRCHFIGTLLAQVWRPMPSNLRQYFSLYDLFCGLYISSYLQDQLIYAIKFDLWSYTFDKV